MSERRWLAELDEHDRDLYEAELAYDNWLQGRQALALQALDEQPDDGYDPRDPGDRLRVEGGEL